MSATRASPKGRPSAAVNQHFTAQVIRGSLIEAEMAAAEQKQAEAQGRTEAAYKRISRAVVEHPGVVIFTTLLTIYALTGDDFRLLCTHKPWDAFFNSMTVLCLVVFSVEIVLSSIGKADYWLGFFFVLDVISTMSLVLDLTWVSEALVSDEDQLDKLRASRSSKIGAKAGRMVRVVRLIRILKLYKAFLEAQSRRRRQLKKKKKKIVNLDDDDDDDDSEDEWEEGNNEESLVGKKLSELTTKRVIILVLGMLVVTPLLETDATLKSESSALFGASLVHEPFQALREFAWRLPPEDQLEAMEHENNAEFEEKRAVYERAMLKYIYYHNWFTGVSETDCDYDLSESGCPKDYDAFLFWGGLVSADPVKLVNASRLARLRKSTVEAFNSEVVNSQWRFAPGGMPATAITSMSNRWDATCVTSKSLDDGSCDCFSSNCYYVAGTSTCSRAYASLGFSLLEETIPNVVHHSVNCADDIRGIERMKIAPVVMTTQEKADVHFVFYFDQRHHTKWEANLNLLNTLFICVVLVANSMLFSKDANELVLNPVEMMISKVNKIRNDPLIATKLADLEFKKEEANRRKILKKTKSSKDWATWEAGKNMLMCKSTAPKTEPMETIMLEKTIIKLGSLLALGLGQAGAQIIAQNMKGSSSGVNAMVRGTRCECIIGAARLMDFGVITQVLQSKIVSLVNQVSEIVHGVVDQYLGIANKNDGEMFLLIWRQVSKKSDADEHNCTSVERMAEMAFVAFVGIIAELNKSPSLALYRGHPGLRQHLRDGTRIMMNFGLHYGWAIEGALGSEFKIDASYISPHVSVATELESATSDYGSAFLASAAVVKLCSPKIANCCRLIDHVYCTGSKDPMEIYSFDLDYRRLKVEKVTARPYVWSNRWRLRARQCLEAERVHNSNPSIDFCEVLEQMEDFDVMRKDYTIRFFHIFNMGYQNYSQGEWDVARRFLETTRSMLPYEDGPSVALLKFMNEQLSELDEEGTANFLKGWKGVRKLGRGAVRTE